MSRNRRSVLATTAVAVLAGVLAPTTPVRSQNVIWDEQVRVGPLVAFPSVRDENVYYYAGTRARLAREGGLPKFSFVRFSEANPEGGEEAIGGGVLHAVVELGVTEQELEQAREALREVNSRARLAGPVAFTSGSFALISSAADDETGEIAKRVVGMGKAPLLEGDRAAVSMLLTGRGANILWTTFNTPTPDVSFQFSMEVDAFRSPVEAVLRADWDKVYRHENLEAGVQLGVDAPQVQVMLGAEIDQTYDELRSEGAVEIVQIGEDESMERATQAAYATLREIMFEPANLAGASNFTPQYRQGAFDRASALYRSAEENQRRRRAEEERRRNQSRSTESSDSTATSPSSHASDLATTSRQARDRVSQLERELQERQESGELEEGQREAAERAIAAARERAERLERESEEATTEEGRASGPDDPGSPTTEPASSAEPEVTVAAYVAYRLKEVRQSGRFEQSMKKYKPETFPVTFSSNVGDLRRYLDDERIFVERALDQMAFRQKQVVVNTSELDSSDFEDFLASVSVQLRKKHESGRVSTDDARIARDTFDDSGADFRLSYVSDGDRDASLFEEFESKVTWNYLAGTTVEGEWETHDGPEILLSPPYRIQDLHVILDEGYVEENDVLGVSVRLYSLLEEGSVSLDPLMLRPQGDTGFGQIVRILVPRESGRFAYEAEFVSRRGGRTTTGKRESQTSFLVLPGEQP
jgi:hypothetical protein